MLLFSSDYLLFSDCVDRCGLWMPLALKDASPQHLRKPKQASKELKNTQKQQMCSLGFISHKQSTEHVLRIVRRTPHNSYRNRKSTGKPMVMLHGMGLYKQIDDHTLDDHHWEILVNWPISSRMKIMVNTSPNMGLMVCVYILHKYIYILV